MSVATGARPKNGQHSGMPGLPDPARLLKAEKSLHGVGSKCTLHITKRMSGDASLLQPDDGKCVERPDGSPSHCKAPDMT